MKQRRITALALAGCLGLASLASAETTQARYEALAAKLKFFPTGDFLYDRPTWDPMPKEWTDGWQAAHREITSPQTPVEDLVALSKHKDAKVRTLALAALFHREDPRLVVDIAPSVTSQEKTFSTLQPISRIPTVKPPQPPPLAEQTLGQVARKMVEWWLGAAGDSSQSFNNYWAARKDRTYCASWFAARFDRATQGTSPLREERIGRIKAVRRDIDKLPQPDRDWTLLWISDRCRFTNGLEHLASRDDLIQAGKRLGPDRLLEALAGKIPSDDPDMANEKGVPLLAPFVLTNAVQLLRPTDAKALLEGEQRLKSPLWVIAAAELQPDWAEVRLREAFTRFAGQYDGDHRADLAAALWRLVGRPQTEFLLNWFYTEPPQRGQFPHCRAAFLRAIHRTPDARKMFAPVIADKRFDELDWQTLHNLAQLVNSWTAKPVVDPEALRSAWHPFGEGHFHWQRKEAAEKYPKQTAELLAQFADWRAKLRASVADWDK